MIGALALADFRDRVRRPAYVVTLIAAVALGFFAVPDADARWVVLYIGSYRGEYNSPYVGTLVALTSVIWLSLGGFYVVRNAIARDVSTGVGQLLAATPMRNASYLAGKLLSNVLVLGSMLAVLAATALVMQLARGESTDIDVFALLKPFVLIALPVMVLVGAVALAMETIGPLRAGFGNVLWFFVWLVGAIAGQSAAAPLGGLGVGPIAQSMLRAMIDQGIDPGRVDFSLGLQYVDEGLRTFQWPGFEVSAGFVGQRFALVLLAVGIALLPVLWFRRFDRAPDSGGAGAPTGTRAGVSPAGPFGAGAPAGRPAGVPGVALLEPPRALPSTEPKRGNAFRRLLVGEFRILVQGVAWWWWAGAVLLAVVALLLPGRAVASALPVLWLWPVLIWSRLGTQRFEYGLEELLGAYPAARLRLLAEWAAGVVLTALTGATVAIRMAVAGDGPGLAAWCTAVLFIPTFALTLGALTRTQRPFQGSYLLIWYTIVNGLAFFDFMGVVRADGRLAGPPAALVLAVTAVLLMVTFLTVTARRFART